ncbi:MAG: hypothetical protein ACPGU7_08610 [Gammaproteobacteria bacterium]
MTQATNAIMDAHTGTAARTAPASAKTPASNSSFVFKIVFAKLIIVGVIATLVAISI